MKESEPYITLTEHEFKRILDFTRGMQRSDRRKLLEEQKEEKFEPTMEEPKP